MAHDPYDALPDLPSFDADVRRRHRRRQPLKNDQVSGIFGAGGHDISPQLSWSGFPAGDQELRGHDVRPGRSDGVGLLALGRREHPRHHRRRCAPVPGDETGSGLPEGAVTLHHDGGLVRFHRRGAAAGARSAPLHRARCMRSTSTTSTITPDSSPAFLGFNLFSHAIARAVITGTYEQK